MSPELRQLALTAVTEGSGQLVLREIEDRDLGVLFEHSSDRDAIRMAAFTSPEFDDRTSFERRWARLRSDSSTTNRVIEIDGRVVGHIASFDLEGRREVTYWIGREDWGRGIATRALQEFLQLEATRPLYAGAASDNAASIRVLTKYGFVMWPCEGVRSAAEDFLLRVGVDHPVAQWIEQRFSRPRLARGGQVLVK